MYILIYIGTNGITWNEACSKTKKKLIEHLKTKGYYWSKKVGSYIDDRNGNSGVDYKIEKLIEL